jgi:hypothetical protein
MLLVLTLNVGWNVPGLTQIKSISNSWQHSYTGLQTTDYVTCEKQEQQKLWFIMEIYKYLTANLLG